MAGKSITSFAKDYSKALILLAISLIVLFFVLGFLHTRLGGNPVGRFAGTVGDLASGQKYNFG